MLSAADKPYKVHSKDVGWDSIDLTITEQRREGQVSFLNIPHYLERSSVESRFSMCAFTDIAIQRGFEVWIVSSAPVKGDIVQVGFLKSADDNAEKVLGAAFSGDKVFRAEVRVINRMCGIERAK